MRGVLHVTLNHSPIVSCAGLKGETTGKVERVS